LTHKKGKFGGGDGDSSSGYLPSEVGAVKLG